MKKITTIFKRDLENLSKILDEINPAAQWVFNGEGIATRKYDGTCCLVKDGILYKRREIKKGEECPSDFVKEDYDEITGKTVGWISVNGNNPEDKWNFLAFNSNMRNGTYELLGKKIQGNKENLDDPVLLKHSEMQRYYDVPLTFEGIKNWLSDKDIEGIVFKNTIDPSKSFKVISNKWILALC